ncbi:MAG: hypothetical protein ABFD16_08020 [Thermoguttaceae bacterium]|jgi:YHS domain-containing protein
MRTSHLFLSVVALTLVFVAAGCNSRAAEQTSSPALVEQPQAQAAAPDGRAELSPADRALAEKQKVCPVSEEPLGSMGKPVKISVKGRVVFLCCDGCEADFKANTDKYLEKLDAANRK